MERHRKREIAQPIVSAEIRRHHFDQFWCCQDRRRVPTDTPQRKRPDSVPATMNPSLSSRNRSSHAPSPRAQYLPRRRPALERWRAGCGWHGVERGDHQAGASVGIVLSAWPWSNCNAASGPALLPRAHEKLTQIAVIACIPPNSQAEFRVCYRVSTASSPMGLQWVGAGGSGQHRRNWRHFSPALTANYASVKTLC